MTTQLADRGRGAHASRKPYGWQATDLLLNPENWVIVGVIGIGWRSGSLAGAAWAVGGTAFATIVPIMSVQEGRRQARLADRRTDAGEHKLAAIGMAIMSIGMVLAIEIGFGAPGAVVTLTVTMSALTLVLLAVARSGWLSVRSTVTSATALLLTLSYGLWLLPLSAVVAWTARSTKERTTQTWPQTVAGLALGTVVPAAIWLAFR